MLLKLSDWKLKNIGSSLEISAKVPGDITVDLYKAGIIKDPYFALNHLELKNWLDKDYIYFTEFEINDLPDEKEDLFICFKGIDLISEIYINGIYIAKTQNMFMQYLFDIGNIVKLGKNTVEVHMFSTTKYMDSLDTKDYFAVFNIPRILLRKEQCCFGWDWSPNISGYGIWQDVLIYTKNKNRLVDVHYTANSKGESVFFVEINYSVRSYYDNDGNYIEVKSEHEDFIRVSIANKPGSDLSDSTVKEIAVNGCKSFITFNQPDVELWWPIGYGKQPLYSYKVELVRDGKVIDYKEGKLGYRDVSLEQRPLDTELLSYQLKVNDKPIYMKGSNWVPIDCFTGCLENEKYKRLLMQAVDANINVLRIWGGGIYEIDYFYDLCDELGIMVWQDLMFACADIPEDNEEFVKNASEEIEYQVKRLRNHVSLVYWCGGNEKTGSTGAKIVRGDWFVNVILRGIVGNLDNTRPFAKQSPCAFSDVANDMNSGETHKNSFELTIQDGWAQYRKNVSKNTVPFISESALMGPHSRQTFEKIFPADKLWPINELWYDRLMENPYAAKKLPFADLEYKFARELYGEIKDFDDFIKKGMLMHAQALKCECEYQRAGKGKTSGFLNWMYSEIWPSGTWAIVDYYTEPKAVYYQIKKSFEPILMSFFYRNDGKTVLFGVNDTNYEQEVCFEYGHKTIDGKIIWKNSSKAVINTTDALLLPLDKNIEQPNTYLYVKYDLNGATVTTLYSWDFWSSAHFVSDFESTVKQIDKNNIEVTIKANSFAKSIFINMPNNCRCTYSDNYFDLEGGEQKTILISSSEDICADNVEIFDFALEK